MSQNGLCYWKKKETNKNAGAIPCRTSTTTHKLQPKLKKPRSQHAVRVEKSFNSKTKTTMAKQISALTCDGLSSTIRPNFNQNTNKTDSLAHKHSNPLKCIENGQKLLEI